MSVEFYEMDDGTATWAVFPAMRKNPYASSTTKQLLWAMLEGDRIVFGERGQFFRDGANRTPRSARGTRKFRVETLERMLEGGKLISTGTGRFSARSSKRITYTTACGEERTIALSDLRAVVEDAKALLKVKQHN